MRIISYYNFSAILLNFYHDLMKFLPSYQDSQNNLDRLLAEPS